MNTLISSTLLNGPPNHSGRRPLITFFRDGNPVPAVLCGACLCVVLGSPGTLELALGYGQLTDKASSKAASGYKKLTD